MASPQDIGKLKRNISETWEEAFEGVDKTSEKFHELVEEFVNFIGDWKEFSDVRRDRLANYIVDLDNVKDHWEDISNWVEENTDSLEYYVGSLSDIKKLFQEISGELGGIRRQTIDNVNVVRNLSRLAGDNLVAIQQEGGLTDGVVASLEKKSIKLQEEYNTRLRILGVLEDGSNIRDVQREEEQKLDRLSRRLQDLEKFQAAGGRLSSLQKEQIRNLREEVKLHTSNLELLNDYNRSVATGLFDRIELVKRYYKLEQEGAKNIPKDLRSKLNENPNAFKANRVNVAANVLRKMGMSEESKRLKEIHGNWETKRVEASVNTDIASKALEEAQANYDRAFKDKNSEEYKERKLGFEDRIASLEKEIKEKEEALVQQKEKLGAAKDFVGNFRKDRSIRGFRNEITGRKASQEEMEEYEKKLKLIDKIQIEEKKINRILQERRKSLLQTQQDYSDQLGDMVVAEENLEKAQSKYNLAEKAEKGIKSVSFFSQIKQYLDVELPNLIAKLGVLLGALIYRQLLKFDEEAVKTKRVIGQWADASALANTKFVTGTEVLRTMRDLGEQFHINPVQVFSSQELGRIAEAQKLTGMSAQAAGNLGVQSKIIGKNADSYRDSIAAGANQANKLNHSAVNLSAVQNDVLNTSRAITMSYGQNVEGLARAASTAASLGMNLQDVENISRNLINFQSSIEAEMQAQLLTGQQLNLARARELALNNDLEGVAKEISSQGVDAAKFSHMNLIQQENMAKALGMSREQMSKMLIMQEINRGLTAQQVAAMTGMRKEDIEALSAQEKWQTMKQRFLETLVPLLEPVLQVVSDILRLLTPIVGAISWILGKVSTLGGIIKEDHVYLRALVGTLAVGIPVALLKGISLVGVLGKAFKGLAKIGVSVGKSIAGWATNLAAAGKNAQATGGILSRIIPQRDYQGRTARQRLRDIRKLEATKSVNPAGAAATSKASASMGSTISKIGRNIGKIALGAAAAVLIAGAVFILAKAAQEFMKVSWGAMAKAGVALLGLVATVAAVGAVMSSGAGTVLILAGAAAMVVMAGAVALLGVALKQFEGIDWKSFDGIGAAMWKLASAGTAAMVAGPALTLGALSLIPGSIAFATAFRILSTVGDVNITNLLQTIKDLKSIEVLEVSKFLELQKIAQALVRASRILRRASFKPLENLSGLGTGLSSTANALVRVGEAIGLVATNLNRLDSEKLTSLRSRSFVGILTGLQRRSERSVNLGEIAESPKETLTKANKELTIKKAEQVSTNQRISVEQKATDLRAIEQKIDKVVAAIGNSRPDWDWVKFEQARGRNLSWISG